MVQIIESMANPLVKTLYKLNHQPTSYRKLQQIWLEGEHLCDSYVQRQLPIDYLVVKQNQLEKLNRYQGLARKTIIVTEQIWQYFSALESTAGIGFLLSRLAVEKIDRQQPSLVLDRLQDAGNVGSILRSAAAFGIKQILALKGTAAIWSNKVLRAGMGAHFALQISEGLTLEQVLALDLDLLVTSSHHGQYLHQLDKLTGSWVFGHEGQGVQQQLQDIAKQQVKIAQPGGQESLNVAAAAAICLYTSSIG